MSTHYPHNTAHNGQPQQRPPLVRATAHSPQMPSPAVSGVASGLSVHLGVSVNIVRLAFALLAIFGGSGLLAYLLLAIFIPKDDAQNSNTQRGANPLTHVGIDQRERVGRRQVFIIGIAFLLLAGLIALVLSNNALQPTHLLAAVLMVCGFFFVWFQGTSVTQWKSWGFWFPVGGGLVLILVGLFLLLSETLTTGLLLTGIIYGVGIVLIILIALAPVAIAVFKQMSNAQENEARESERASIAAHLHDSVLQTLTLIRGNADNPTQVRALALGQERELRAWLYTGNQHVATSTAQALREAIGTVETTYGTAIDVVTVGDTTPQGNELAIVAAAAEAATNAVRHGAPPVTVYMETHPATTEIFIKDHGPGFALDAIPPDRHGVRGSIIGRVERVGGQATIRQLNPGTEVHLVAPRTPDAS